MGANFSDQSGTPWFLLAIYVVLAGGVIDRGSASAFGELVVLVSLVPALVGVYLTFRPHYLALE